MMLSFKELLAQQPKWLEANLSYKSNNVAGRLTRVCLALCGVTLASLTLPVNAQTSAPTRSAVPFYSAEQAMTGVYAYHLPPLSTRFVAEADALVAATDQYCQALPTLAASFSPQQAAWAPLHAQWQHTMVAWESLSTPAIGPVVLRRSQRQIDFWPTRPELINKALVNAPQTLADMERVGTLAKGLPAMELLLAQWRPTAPGRVRAFDGRAPQRGKPLPELPYVPPTMPAATCHYLSLLAEGIQVESHELKADLDTWATKDWSASPEDTGAAMAEWVNQWLAGVERLRWAHLEKPIKANQTMGNAMKGNPTHFARIGRDANLASWRAQWHSLQTQAGMTPAQYQSPPQPAQALLPIEALLLGKGHMALAQRWAKALDAVSVRMDKLLPTAPSRVAEQRELLALTQALKAVTVLYQGEVASALDIPLGFSDADGD